MSAYRFASFAAAFSIALFANACCDCKVSEETSTEATATPAGFVCPPCGMDMPADAGLREIGGMKFAVCNDYCAEKVAAEPAKYAEHAVQ